jgi:endoglycosylceramidase
MTGGTNPAGAHRGALLPPQAESGLRRLALRACIALSLALPAAAPGVAWSRSDSVGTGGPMGVLSHVGRWLTDEAGRVVLLHGTNFVEKFPPVAPADVGFGRDQAVFLREQGFNVLRLGLAFGAMMPAPGEIDADYVASVAETARTFAREGIYVLIDIHQDGYGPLVHGNGFPEWATLTDGLPNPPEPFPQYYVTNPALQRAFDNFWDDRPGPDGVPLQEHYATALRAIAAAIADEPRILGYDLMNEPWPGANWQACLTGCPGIEQARLVPFGERMAGAIREVDPGRLVFSEPWVLFNFGLADTSLSGIGAPASGLSFHVYALDPAQDEAVIDRAIAASSRGDAILATEFGATDDTATIRRLTDAFDTRLVPWIFWAWGNMVFDRTEPPTPDNVRMAVVEALARPFASATNGTPESFAFDPDTGSFEYAWSTRGPSGEPAPAHLSTAIVMPPSVYPEGYAVTVENGHVLSQPCAATLLVASAEGASSVRVRAMRTEVDTDGDGIADACDSCPNDPLDDADGDGVCGDIDNCPTTAAGDLVDRDGCSIADLCPCENDWKSHGAYVRCVAHASNDFRDSGLISGREKGEIVSTAAKAECGSGAGRM